jgi:hypothetical protein
MYLLLYHTVISGEIYTTQLLSHNDAIISVPSVTKVRPRYADCLRSLVLTLHRSRQV